MAMHVRPMACSDASKATWYGKLEDTPDARAIATAELHTTHLSSSLSGTQPTRNCDHKIVLPNYALEHPVQALHLKPTPSTPANRS